MPVQTTTRLRRRTKVFNKSERRIRKNANSKANYKKIAVTALAYRGRSASIGRDRG